MKRLTTKFPTGYLFNLPSVNDEKAQEKYANEIAEKLGQYEDAEEQGLLLRLPCKAGDTVYVVDGNHIHTLKAQNDIAIISGELCIYAENPKYADNISYENLGKTVFLTKEQALKKMIELERGEQPENI